MAHRVGLHLRNCPSARYRCQSIHLNHVFGEAGSRSESQPVKSRSIFANPRRESVDRELRSAICDDSSSDQLRGFAFRSFLDRNRDQGNQAVVVINNGLSSSISESTKLVWLSNHVTNSTSSHAAIPCRTAKFIHAKQRRIKAEPPCGSRTMDHHVRGTCCYGTTTPVKRIMSCFQNTPNVIATTKAITMSLINDRRVCAFRLVARRALARIACVSSAALRSASDCFTAGAARFRFCGLRYGPMAASWRMTARWRISQFRQNSLCVSLRS
jgi:hypothetical protein